MNGYASVSAINSTRQDDYPSHQGQSAHFIKRQDPVVYSEDRTKPPVEHELIEHYRQNGFVVLPRFFSDDKLCCWSSKKVSAP